MKLLNQKVLLVVLFVIFLFLRLFVDSTYTILGADNLKFLELSKRFPNHTLSNNQLYLQHPPLYPYIIHFFNLFFHDDLIAAVVVSLISACLSFFFLYKLFMMLSNDFYVSFTAMIFFTLSVELIEASHAVLRESFVIMLIYAAIYYYIKSIKLNEPKSIIIATIISGITSLTTDYVIFLLPVFALSYIFFTSKLNIKKFIFPNLKYAILPVLAIILLYMTFWLGLRYYQFSTNEYYPSGLEGTPVSTKNFGIRQLIDPKSFPDYEPAHGISTPIKNIAYNLGYMFNVEPFDIPRGLNFSSINYLLFPKHIAYMIIIYLPLAIFALLGFVFTIKDLINSKKLCNNTNLFLIFLFLIFISSLILQKSSATSPRWLIPAYAFLYYFIAYGLVNLFKKFKIFQFYNKLIIGIVILLLLLIPFWYYQHNNFVLFNKKFVLAQNTADFINQNLKEDDVVMAQPGYNYKLIHLTGRRMVGLPTTSANLMNLIKYYDVGYLIFGRFYTWDYYKYNQETVEFIRNNPDKFKLIATIKEDYGDLFNKEDKARTDEVYVYKVLRN